MWYGKNDIICRLGKTYPIRVYDRDTNPLTNFTTILKVGGFITRESFIWCPTKQASLIVIGNLQGIGVDQITFGRSALDKKSFDIATDLYFDYMFGTFSDNLSIFNLNKFSENTFTLSWNTELIKNNDHVKNYINYLSLMSVAISFELNNTDFNPTSEYKPSIHKLGSSKDVTFGKALFGNVPTERYLRVYGNVFAAKQYVQVYGNDLGYFIKVGYLLDMGYFDHQNFEERLRVVYSDIWWDVSQHDECYQPHIDISTDSNIIDIYVTVGISQASEEDWKFLLEIPCYF